jgi:hypothetical protein
MTGYTFTATSQRYSSLSANKTTTNFTATPQSAMQQQENADVEVAERTGNPGSPDAVTERVDVLASYNRLLEMIGG